MSGTDWRLIAGNGFIGEIGGSGTVIGGSGLQDVTVLDLAGTISFDPSFNRGGDIVRLAGNADAWQVVQSGSSVVLSDGDTSVVLPVGEEGLAVVFADGARTLRFDDAEDAILLGTQAVSETPAAVSGAAEDDSLPGGADPEASARLFLAEGASVTAGGQLDIFGTNGAEEVSLNGGEIRLDPSFNRGGDRLTLDGAAEAFEAFRTGSSVAIEGGDTQLLLPVGAEAVTLSFDDGDRTLRYDAQLETVLFGTQTIVEAAAALEASAGGTAEQVLFWNEVALETIAEAGAIPTYASRALACQSIAVFDAIQSICGGDCLWVDVGVDASADIGAAVAYASYTTLLALFPDQSAFLEEKLAEALPDLGSGDSLALGQALGTAVAQTIETLRAIDGYDALVDPVLGDEPGEWVLTPPGFASPEAPQWALLDPFVMTSPDQFRGVAPPALDSAEYAAALNEVKELGAVDSATRTEEQTEIALFWRDAVGTYTPPGHWNVIAQIAAAETGGTTAENALTFAMLNTALADAAVAAWDSKYFYNVWRPISAIRNADLDGNDLTEADPDWTPLFNTPAHPDDPSGHSTFSAAGATVLTALFGEDFAFSVTSAGLPGVTRSFDSFDEAAQEAGRSRIYGGIHNSVANETGLAIGADVGAWVLDTFAGLNGGEANFSLVA